jgi:hypothetical protein
LGQQRPRPKSQSKARVGAIEGIASRNDVQQGETFQAIGMVQRKSVADTSASVMTCNGETIEADDFHHLHHVASHRAFGVRGVVGRRGRFAARPIPSQVRANDREVCCQGGRNIAPHDVCLWEPVEKQKRGSASCIPNEYLRFFYFDRC